MSIMKALDVDSSGDNASIEEHVKHSDLYILSEGTRAFEYQLNEKSAKAKLIKNAKRIPLEIEDNSTSSNLIFCVGSWKNAVIPAVSYWKEVKGTKSCKVGDYTIKVAGVKVGTDKIGMNVVFYGDRDKIVCHIYHTTQLILVNGHGYKKFIETFLKPFLQSKINACLEENI